MSKLEINSKYELYDRVYHITQGSPIGVILDIAYYYSTKQFKYYVTFEINNDIWCTEKEINKK